jgi:hypothetical protein
MTVPELKAKLEQFSHIVSQFSVENPVSRELKNFQREINEHFRYASFKDEEEKAALRLEFDNAISAFRQKQEEINVDNEKFAAETLAQVEKIREVLGEETAGKVFSKEDFIDIKKSINETIARFRQNRFPSKESKDLAWEKFSACRDRLKKEEDNYYLKLREEKEKQYSKSAELSEKIIPAIETCHPEVNEQNMADRLAAFLSFASAENYKAPGFDFLNGEEKKENTADKKLKNPLLLKSESLRALRKFINENREIISKEDKNKIHFVVEEVQADLDKAWTVYKDELQKKRDAWEEKKKENDGKRKEWEQKQQEFLTRLEDRLSNQTSFKAKIESIYQKQVAFQEKLEKRLVDQLAFIGKLNIQLDGLDEKYESARTDQFRETVTEWINEKKSKIADVEDDIADLEDKLKDVKTRTEELSDKMREVETSKKEITAKIEEVKKKLSKVKSEVKPAVETK